MYSRREIHLFRLAQFDKEITVFDRMLFLEVTQVARKLGIFFGILALFFMLLPSSVIATGAYPYRFPPKDNFFHAEANTVIGVPQKHRIHKKDSLIGMARDYKLGFNELEDLYPLLDPWVPPVGMTLTIPTQWVLPDTEVDGIVINVAELRLYYFMKKIHMVKTYPIGIGREGWFTPLGDFRITSKRAHPTWYVPLSLQAKYGIKTMPPGPENPLGDYYMGLSNMEYGIHGTNFPWAVGRLVTHGCIRLYPEDIVNLFQAVQVGTPVKIIYSPVKFGIISGKIYVEVHQDIYHRIEDFSEYGRQLLTEKGLVGKVDMVKFQAALDRKDGMPMDITPSDQTAQKID